MVNGICALCKEETLLCESHIVPEFFYDLLYDEKHRLNLLNAEPGQRRRFQQKGVREPLLCIDCDTKKISRLENYARGVFLGGQEITVQNGQDRIIVTGLDYKTLKLFQLSILWRAGVAKQQFFSNVNLGPYNERLREMIISEDPGTSDQIGCLVICLMLEEKPLGDLITQPLSIRLNGHRAYRFVFGGFFWIYFASRHAVGPPWRDLFLREDGTMMVPLTDGIRNSYLLNLVRRFSKRNPRWLV